MAIPRRPGDTSVKFEYRSVSWRYMRDSTTMLSGSGSIQAKHSIRPTYAKGAVITLPGGDTFRKATSYSHESWVLGESRASVFGGPYSGYRHWYAEDDGRGISLYLQGRPVVRGAGSIPIDMRNEAVTKALNEIANQKAMLGENLATLGMTARLFSGKALALANLLKAARSRKDLQRFWYKSYRDLMREGVDRRLARLYLEYVYGFKPLMEDLYGLSELMKEESNKTLILSGRGKSRRRGSGPDSPWTPSTGSTMRREQCRYNHTVRTKLFARIDPNWQGARSLNQLGLLNPFGLAWELVPWSFVVDWLLPIGPVLNALSAPAGLIFVDGSTAMKASETMSLRYHISAGTWTGANLSNDIPAQFPITYEGYSRITHPTWPLPGLWIDHDPLRGDRFFKAAALAILRTSSYKPPYKYGSF